MQISQHSITVPAAKHLDDVKVNIATKEGHGAACPEGSGTKIRRFDASGRVLDSGGLFDAFGDVFGFDRDKFVVVVVGSQRFVVWCVVQAVVHNEANCCSCGAAQWILGSAVGDYFTPFFCVVNV